MKITAHERALLDEQGTIEPVHHFTSPIGDGPERGGNLHSVPDQQQAARGMRGF